MANFAGAISAYLADSLKIFALPVTTIRRASDRNLGVGDGVGILAALTVVAGLLRLVISYVPGGDQGTISVTALALEEFSHFLFFLISYLVLFALIITFGGSTNLGRLLSAKLSLAAAIVGALVLALFAKLLIGLLFLGQSSGVAGGLYLLGSEFGFAAIGLVLAVYTIIVARFGGRLSWAVAAIVGLLHFAIVVALVYAYQVIILRNELSVFARSLEI